MSRSLALALLALVAASACTGCSKSSPGDAPAALASASAGPPDEVWTRGELHFEARYRYFPSVAAATSAYPRGSMDAVVIDLPASTAEAAVVEVTVRGGTAPKRYTTTFRTAGGFEARKTWSRGDASNDRPFRVLTTVPPGARETTTRSVDSP